MKAFSLTPIAATNRAENPMLPIRMFAPASLEDAALVIATLAGDRDSFSQIVTRRARTPAETLSAAGR